VIGGQFLKAAGGKGANQAVAAARLGADVSFVARVGTDTFGDEALAGYEREGIRTDLVARDAFRPTGIALILVSEQGENLISVASGANEGLSPADVDQAADRIRNCDALLLQLEVPLPAVLRAAELARASRVPVILDPAPVPDGGLPPELLRLASCLTPNEAEAETLTGIAPNDETSAIRAAERLRAAGAECVLLTRGAKGVVVASAGGTFSREGVRVEAVDATAAGDAFNAAFACALVTGSSLNAAVYRACFAAALSTTQPGSQPSLPTSAQVEAFVAVEV
jgi:ribokinase